MKDANAIPSTLSHAKEVLRARALALARTREPAPDTNAALEVLEFRLAQERYALETRHVREVYPLTELTPLPCTPPFVAGIVNVRGRIACVIDIKKFLDLPDRGLTDFHAVILVRDGNFELGLLADVIVGVHAVSHASLQPAASTLAGAHGDYLKGLTAEGLVVLDMGRILADPKIMVHEEVQN